MFVCVLFVHGYLVDGFVYAFVEFDIGDALVTAATKELSGDTLISGKTKTVVVCILSLRGM